MNPILINHSRSLRHGRAGFTLVETLIVAGALVVMTVLGIAGLNKTTQKSAGMNCGTNLRLIQEAKRAALEEDPTLTTFNEAQLCQYLPGGKMPTCPGHGSYTNQQSLGALARCTLDSGRSDGLHNVHTPGLAGGTSTLTTIPGGIKGGGHPIGGPILIGEPIIGEPIELPIDEPSK